MQKPDMIPELVLLNGVLPAGSGAVTFQLTNTKVELRNR